MPAPFHIIILEVMLGNPDQNLLKLVEQVLRDECHLAASAQIHSAPILVGVSGGPDSACLLHVLHRLGLPLLIAHLDHALRLESSAEAQAVQHLAEGMGLATVIERQDAAAAAKLEGLSIEEAARDLRYRFLFRTAVANGAQAVAVAHTADDQVETFLMHLLRGAGLSGLRGMAYRSLPNPWNTTIPLLRPFLDVWRTEIEAYLSRNGLQAIEDASNRDWRFYRNRLRGEALPYLDSLNPGVRARFHQTAKLLRDDDELIEKAALSAWQDCLVSVESDALAFDADGLRAQPAALLRRVLRRAASWLRPGLRDIDYAAIQRAADFLYSSTRSGRADWIAGLRLEIDGKHLWLVETDAPLPSGDWPQLPPDAQIGLVIPSETTLPGGWRLRAGTLALTPELRAHIRANADPYQAWLDRAALPETLTMRSRHPGERIRPFGLGGHSLKLSDLMINSGIPLRARAGWPLVLAGDEIVWVPGCRLADAFRIQESTKEALHLELKSEERR